ncbi:Putative cold shock protein (fragment) [Pseudomonas sp. 8Z]
MLCELGSERSDVFGLQAFLALGYTELDLLSLDQGAVTVTANGAKVYEHIWAAFALNKPIALGIIEPFDGSALTLCH